MLERSERNKGEKERKAKDLKEDNLWEKWWKSRKIRKGNIWRGERKARRKRRHKRKYTDKNKTKFSSYIGKFGWDRVLSYR
jgi:hypothetical protein